MKKIIVGVIFITIVFVGCTGSRDSDSDSITFSSQSGLPHFDPHNFRTITHSNMMSQVYEALVERDQSYQVQQGLGLAASWRNISDNEWEFTLQQGVKFHNGAEFTAEDVYVSWERARDSENGPSVARNLIADIKVISPYEILITTNGLVLVLPEALASLSIVDSDWLEEHDAVEPLSSKDSTEKYTVRHANGTGPYKLTSLEPNGEINFERFAEYRNEQGKGVIEQIRFVPIESDATRLSALLSGEIDLAFPIPIQDWDRVESSSSLTLHTGIEARPIFLGLDQYRDVLIGAEEGATNNPFKDVRVREAVNLAIDIETINEKIMKGKALPIGILSNEFIGGHPQNTELNTMYPYDVERAKELMAEAGYAEGFSVRFDAPSGRYINDAEIAQAIVAMLAKINITANLSTQPRGPYFQLLFTEREVSMYMLGWGPVANHNLDIVTRLLAYKDERRRLGGFNIGLFNNEEVTEAAAGLLATIDQDKSLALIEEAHRATKEHFGYVPLLSPPLSFAAKSKYNFIVYPDAELKFHEITLSK